MTLKFAVLIIHFLYHMHHCAECDSYSVAHLPQKGVLGGLEEPLGAQGVLEGQGVSSEPLP